VKATYMNSRDFNQQVAQAKRAARTGPVFITDRGREAFVLLTIEDYRATARPQQGLFDALSMSDAEGMDFDIDPEADTASMPGPRAML
jgi:prevent-host-death family protein